MNQEEIDRLLSKYKDNSCTEEEYELLYSWYLEKSDKESGLSLMEVAEAEEKIWGHLQSHLDMSKRVKRIWPLVSAAAALLICLGAALFVLKGDRHGVQNTSAIRYANDIAPGRNRAFMILGDGDTIVLDSAKAGVALASNALVYSDGSKVQPDDHQLQDLNIAAGLSQKLTISTPRGGTYQLTLPDGTKVWLNAASSMSFPSSFSPGESRTVDLFGEAYFEVSKLDHHTPFIVNSANQRLEVLGTHFNVNCYDDEPETRTTLLEGSVKISELKGNRSVLLMPGQQSVLTDKSISVAKVNTDGAVAWKNGDFIFTEEPLSSIMRKVSRWYDVDVTLLGNIGSTPFEGSISRFKNVSELLRKFELTENVHFKIEGRRITAMP